MKVVTPLPRHQVPAAELARLRVIEEAARVVVTTHRCAETSHGDVPEMHALYDALATLPSPRTTTTAAEDRGRGLAHEADRAQLVAALGMRPGATWGEAIGEVERVRRRVEKADAASREWAAANPERTRELNLAAAHRYRRGKRAENPLDKPPKCRACGQVGHNRRTCGGAVVEMPADSDAPVGVRP